MITQVNETCLLTSSNSPRTQIIILADQGYRLRPRHFYSWTTKPKAEMMLLLLLVSDCIRGRRSSRAAGWNSWGAGGPGDTEGAFLPGVWDTQGSPFEVWFLGCSDNHLRQGLLCSRSSVWNSLQAVVLLLGHAVTDCCQSCCSLAEQHCGMALQATGTEQPNLLPAS